MKKQETIKRAEDLRKHFEDTGYTAWINADLYPNGRIYTQEYTEWLEKKVLSQIEGVSTGLNAGELKATEVFADYWQGDVPWDEKITVEYPAIINAMEDFAEQTLSQERKKWEAEKRELVESINQIEFDLYTSLPTGKVDSWELLETVKKHIESLGQLTQKYSK